MVRLFIAPEAFQGCSVMLTGEVLHHARTVLRLREGEDFLVTDGAGGEYRVRLERGGRSAVPARILEKTEPRPESRLRITLAQAVPRGERFSFVLQKSVELGVTTIVPVLSRRALPVGHGGGPDARMTRWRRIVEAAVAQSGRAILPTLCPPCGWDDILAADAGEELKILLWEGERRGLREILGSRAGLGSVLVAVGPEGGWSDVEIEGARKAGFLAAKIGPRILRTETVGLAALAVLQFLHGDLG